MERAMRRVSDSRTEEYQLIMRRHLNGYDRVFGGLLLSWIDHVAAVTGRRHIEGKATTALVDEVRLLGPIVQDDTVILESYVTWAGSTSLEVKVEVYRRPAGGRKELVGDAYVVMVGLDENERPSQVPGLILETPEEQENFSMGEARMALRKKRRALERLYRENKLALPNE